MYMKCCFFCYSLTFEDNCCTAKSMLSLFWDCYTGFVNYKLVTVTTYKTGRGTTLKSALKV